MKTFLEIMSPETLIALITIISSTLITLVSNIYSLHIRKTELKVQTFQNLYNIHYSEKAKAFKEFVSVSSSLVINITEDNNYELVLSSAHKALLLCNSKNKELLNDFIAYVDERLFSREKPTDSWRHSYWEKLSVLTQSLNEELQEASSLLFFLKSRLRKE